MARGARGVTCRECGCLNFSSEHEVCDKCRVKSLTFRPTARRSSQSGTRDRASTSTNGLREEMAHSNGKKRRYEETKNTSNKKHEDKRVKAPPKKQPDVIDLISDDDDDDVVVHKVFPKTIESRKQEKEDKTKLNEGETRLNELFQSREFPTVTFSESDFPSMEEGALMRKRAVDGSAKHSLPTVGTGTPTITGKSNSASSQPVSMPPSQNSLQQGTKPAQGKTIDRKLEESKPPPAIEGKEEVKTQTVKIPTQTSGEGNGSGEATQKNAVATTNVRGAGNGAVQLEKDAVQAKQAGSSVEQEDPLFQSRVFDSVEFKAPDFVTVFEGMAAARRSHPPAPKAVSSLSSSKATEATTPKAIEAASSKPTETTSSKATEATSSKATETIASKATDTTTSTSVGPAAVTVSASASANEVMGPAKTPMVAVISSAKPALPQTTTTKPISEADSKSAAKTGTTPINSAVASTLPTPKTVAAAPAAVQPSAPPSSANPPQTASIPTLTPASAAPLPPTASSSAPVQAAPVFSTQVSATSTTPPTVDIKMKAAAKAKPLAVPSTSSPVPAAVPLPSGVPSTRLPTSAPSVSRPAPVTEPKATRPHSMTTSTVGVTPAAAKVPSTTSRNTVASKADAVNVLLPKKKHSEESQRNVPVQQPLSAVTDASDADAVLFVKVNAAPLGVTPVEPPVLGYCSPEFLTFMRECGDEDADEDDDPEEVSRSQLKLLDVVDLTNLSDSEDSDAESPMPTPRASATSTSTLQGLPDNGQVKNLGLLPATAATTAVSGNRTWYVPTLDRERTRTRPEKVMCELCEETGLPSRLIRCPTCSKYYHKKCARENGDENICWNCELGSMIDDSELDQEHAKHNSEYLAYLRGIRRSVSPDGREDEDEEEEVEEEEQEKEGENNQVEGDEGKIGDGDAEMPTPGEGDEDNNTFSEEGSAKSAGKRWKEFIGGATADVDDSFHEVTKRIAEELRDEKKKHIYSRGFVSRDEFEEQMAEVEEYYISEEARLQQLEREKALEGRTAAEARRAQAAVEQAAQGAAPNGEQPADSSVNANNPPSTPTSVVQPVATLGAGGSSTSTPLASAATTTQSVAGPSSTPTVPTTVNAAHTAPPSAVPVSVRPAVPVAGRPAFTVIARPAVPVVGPPTISVAWRPAAPRTATTHPAIFPRPPFFAVPRVPAPTAAYTAAFRAAAAKSTPTTRPPPAPQP